MNYLNELISYPNKYFPNEFGKDICDIQKDDDHLIFTVKPDPGNLTIVKVIVNLINQNN